MHIAFKSSATCDNHCINVLQMSHIYITSGCFDFSSVSVALTFTEGVFVVATAESAVCCCVFPSMMTSE